MINLQQKFSAPDSDDPKVLKRSLSQMAHLLNLMTTDLNRSQATTVTGIAITLGGASGGSGGGGSTTADNVRTGSQSVTSAGATISFPVAFSASYSFVAVFAWFVTSDGALAFPTIDPTTITLSEFTVSGIYETVTVYYHAIAR